MGCTEEEAFVHWNLVPLATRRDIAMLGLIHRTVLGAGPKHFQSFFRLKRTTPVAHHTRRAARRHDYQLEETYYRSNCPELLRRSALGLTKVYNLLPARVVNTDSVKEFQRLLRDLLLERLEAGCDDWKETLSPRGSWWRHALR